VGLVAAAVLPAVLPAAAAAAPVVVVVVVGSVGLGDTFLGLVGVVVVVVA